MAQANKIDSNITALAFAEEESLGVLPGSPVWNRLEPNSYSDFGGDIKTVAPNPINPNRQRRKGKPVDIDTAGGFNHNLTFYNLTKLMQGALFASVREQVTSKPLNDDPVAFTSVSASTDGFVATDSLPSGFLENHLILAGGFANNGNNGIFVVESVSGDDSVVTTAELVDEASPPAAAYVRVVGYQSAAGDLDVVNSGTSFPVINSTALDFTTLGLVPGQWIYLGGDASPMNFTNAANNGFKRIRSISANQLVIDKSGTTMVTEVNTTKTVQMWIGDVLKNELDDLIVRRTYHVERTLGADELSAPMDIQSEVLTGAAVNEVTINIPQADLINVDFKFMAIDNEQRLSTDGPLQTSVVRPKESDVFNSTSDVPRMRMSIISDTIANPSALFAFITEGTITLNNNITTDKAVGVFGGFDLTTGTFEVGGSATAYFSTVEAVKAVRDGADVTVDFIIGGNNKGLVIDLPLISLGDARLKVEQDKSIMLPLKMDAATAVEINPNLDYTVMITLFNYLPTVAA